MRNLILVLGIIVGQVVFNGDVFAKKETRLTIYNDLPPFCEESVKYALWYNMKTPEKFTPIEKIKEDYIDSALEAFEIQQIQIKNLSRDSLIKDPFAIRTINKVIEKNKKLLLVIRSEFIGKVSLYPTQYNLFYACLSFHENHIGLNKTRLLTAKQKTVAGAKYVKDKIVQGTELAGKPVCGVGGAIGGSVVLLGKAGTQILGNIGAVGVGAPVGLFLGMVDGNKEQKGTVKKINGVIPAVNSTNDFLEKKNFTISDGWKNLKGASKAGWTDGWASIKKLFHRNSKYN